MNQKLKNKITRLSKDLKDVPNGQCRHISFIVQRNNIVSIGFNNYHKTHPAAKDLNYRFGAIHSELDAYLRVRWDIEDFSKYDLINVRINRFSKIKMSMPCHCCLPFVIKLGFRRIWYSDWNGNFRRLA